MNFMARHSAITTNRHILQHKTIISPKTFFNSNSSIDMHSTSSFYFTNKPINRQISLQFRVPLHNSSQNPSNTQIILNTLILCIFSFTLLSLRLVSNILLPDFPNRWNQLIAFSEEAEDNLCHCPSYLWQAVVAYEDRRFFRHRGIDPIGIARAVLSFSARGGGSTVTQQLIKNTFLKNERTFLRKVVEIVLALALERRISKPRILSSYLSKIYWGHGVYGIESASILYFGKHPSLLSLGESAMLVGMIPAPELRSPLRNPSRGKIIQARVLKRMIEVGFLDTETALVVVNQSLRLRSTGSGYTDRILTKLSSYSKGHGISLKQVWDWETESMIWEVREEMERWVSDFSMKKNSRKNELYIHVHKSKAGKHTIDVSS